MSFYQFIFAVLAMIAEVARKRGIITVCDNTFASPAMQRPLRQPECSSS